MMDPRAMSVDGYIADQDYTDKMNYGVYPSSYNGCGWIAVFNMLHAMGAEDAPEEVFERMLTVLTYKGRHGTPFPDIAHYCRKYGIAASRLYGRAGLLRRIAGVPCGILRYAEGNTPHYITFIKAADGRYRFLNAADGQEDFTADMDSFIKSHISHHDLLIRILIPENRQDRPLCMRKKQRQF